MRLNGRQREQAPLTGVCAPVARFAASKCVFLGVRRWVVLPGRTMTALNAKASVALGASYASAGRNYALQ